MLIFLSDTTGWKLPSGSVSLGSTAAGQGWVSPPLPAAQGGTKALGDPKMLEGWSGCSWESDRRGCGHKPCFHGGWMVTEVTGKRVFTALAHWKGEVKLRHLVPSKAAYGKNGISVITFANTQEDKRFS